MKLRLYKECSSIVQGITLHTYQELKAKHRHSCCHNCTIMGNSAVRGGGGVHCWQNLSTVLTNCVIISNTVQYAGGGVLADSGSAILANCVIARNTDATWGGGLCSFGDSSVTIRNCTVCENYAFMMISCIFDMKIYICINRSMFCEENASYTLFQCVTSPVV